MKLLLDQGLPRSTVPFLRKCGFSSVHVGEVGLADASDATILDYSRKESCIVATFDADFHTLLALSGATFPSVVRLRIEGLRGEALADLLAGVLRICEEDLLHGAVVSVTEANIRVRRLPLFP
jgi:predicted nuclease of predicted toxin-antitoxin system